MATQDEYGQHPKPESGMHRRLGIDESFNYTPPKTDGDHWANLVKPLMEADKLRCDSWKDEVQNLLIFAGLFSAVVTPFVVESYKFLKPDANDAILGLLAHIANNLDRTPDITPPFPPSAGSGSPLINTTFSPTSTSIRMNIFWFLSLILSLLTVLIGTIALQWLREHQSYSTFSSKEALAVLHMRSESIERWYVPQMFAALPLLLQAALVLFFAGLIDFALPLGVELMVTVSVMVGLTLIFLAATTIIPTLQGFVFYLPTFYPRQKIPIPCPYKSPQSQAFRMLSRLTYDILSRLVPSLHHFWHTLWSRHGNSSRDHHIAPYISGVWTQRSWSQFDLKWLFLRDICHQRILDNAPDLHRHRSCWDTEFPLSDATQCVVEAVISPQSSKFTEAFFIAAFHCFEELSEPIYRLQYCWWDDSYCRRDRRSRYLQELVTARSEIAHNFLSTALVHGGHYAYDACSDYHSKEREQYITTHSTLFHQDHLSAFLKIILNRHRCPSLEQYRVELGSHMVQYLLKGAVVPFRRSWEDPFSSVTLVDITLSSWATMNTEDFGNGLVHDLFVTFFRSTTAEHIPQDKLLKSLHIHAKIPAVLGQFAYLIAKHTLDVLDTNSSDNKTNISATSDTYIFTLKSMTSRLNNEISRSPSDPTSRPIPLFYFSAIFMGRYLGYLPETEWPLLRNRNNDQFISGLQALLDVLRRYRKWMGARRNELIEESFRGTDQFTATPRFSDGWWEFLDQPPRFTSLHSSGVLLADSLGNVLQNFRDSTPSGSSEFERQCLLRTPGLTVLIRGLGPIQRSCLGTR